MVERREVQRLLTVAANYYHRVLPTKIREDLYRKHYGLTDETIDGLQLGWADGTCLSIYRCSRRSPRAGA